MLQHPLFWNAEKRLNFFEAVSEFLHPNSKPPKDVTKAVNDSASVVFGNGSWKDCLDQVLLEDLNKTAKNFNDKSVCDLVRVIRNKQAHYDDPKASALKVSSLWWSEHTVRNNRCIHFYEMIHIGRVSLGQRRRDLKATSDESFQNFYGHCIV